VEVNEESTNKDVVKYVNNVTAPFKSRFKPSDMRQLALVAHNHMKPAMAHFIKTYSEILKKFRITGTQTTMLMCKQLWGDDNPDIEYGLSCTSGPLGGDAQVAALMCMEDLGGLIFFTDPLSAHPHQADIDSLIRLGNVGNIIMCSNPTSAMSMMHTFKGALEKGDRGAIPSFFLTLESPAVATYKLQQQLALQTVVGQHRDSELNCDDSVQELNCDDEED
jgi:methylglyoxal synthase